MAIHTDYKKNRDAASHTSTTHRESDMSIKVLASANKNLIVEGIFANITSQNDLKLVGVAGDHLTYLRLYEELKPDVVLLCDNLNGQSSLGLIREIVRKHPEIKIVSINSSCTRQTILETIQAGAKGYVSPVNCDSVELLRAIRTVAQGSTYICEAALSFIEKTPAGAGLGGASASVHCYTASNSVLGAREEQVLRLIADGNSSKEIAQQLYIATSTVEVHRRNIMDKTGLRNIADLTRYAIRTKLIEL